MRKLDSKSNIAKRDKALKAGQFCPVDERCGACQLLAIPYADQLTSKQAEIEELFADALAEDGATIQSILGMDEPLHYRNKVISPYAPGKRTVSKAHAKDTKHSQEQRAGKRNVKNRSEQREILCGMYAQGTHRIIPTDECLIENQVAKKIIQAIRLVMMRYGIEPYNEDTGKGFLRHAIVRVGHRSNEVLVTLVTNAEDFPGAKNFARELVKRCPEITTIVQNVNTRATNVILGEGKERTLYGPGFILDRLCGLSFRISSHSFYQVNAVQTEVLYEAAIELAHLQGTERILDAYCGTGTIGLVAARALQEKTPAAAKDGALVVGVDKVESAIVDARNNAKHNGIENASFIAEDAGVFMNEMAGRDEALDVLFMDPPRSGASLEFLQATAHLHPRRIVYISCNPKTQARDVVYLRERGYRLEAIQPVDMFPHTTHIETVCLLTREKSVKSYAYVDITPSELGMGGKVKKPTYKQIQAYVLETHGLKVSPLYIANVKDEFGLEKQFSYEEAGMSAKKRPNCPSEKRAAIIDALIHFGMLDEDARETE